MSSTSPKIKQTSNYSPDLLRPFFRGNYGKRMLARRQQGRGNPQLVSLAGYTYKECRQIKTSGSRSRVLPEFSINVIINISAIFFNSSDIIISGNCCWLGHTRRAKLYNNVCCEDSAFHLLLLSPSVGPDS